MLGNVVEPTFSLGTTYAGDSQTEPVTWQLGCYRGGAYNHGWIGCRSAARHTIVYGSNKVGSSYPWIGMRVAIVTQPFWIPDLEKKITLNSIAGRYILRHQQGLPNLVPWLPASVKNEIHELTQSATPPDWLKYIHQE